MNTVDFWRLIDTSREASGGDPEDQLLHLDTLLRELDPDDIVEFDRIFCELHQRAYTWALWGAAYVIGGGCSDDGFMDFRGWLISRGEQVYEAAIADPDSLADVVSPDDDVQVEGFQYLPREVWAAVTQQDEDDFPSHDDIDYRAAPEGEEWGEDDLDGLYPRLNKIFN